MPTWKNMPVAVAAVSLALSAVGTTMIGSTFGLWEDKEETSVSFYSPGETMSASINGRELESYTYPGFSFSNDTLWRGREEMADLAENLETYRLIEINATTEGNLGGEAYSNGYSNFVDLSGRGPILSKATQWVYQVDDPSECAPGQEPKGEPAMRPGESNKHVQLFEVDGAVTLNHYNESASLYFCHYVSLSVDDGVSGSHENTVTASARSSESGESVSSEDSWTAGVTPGAVEYTDAMIDEQMSSDRGYVNIEILTSPYVSENPDTFTPSDTYGGHYDHLNLEVEP